MIIKCLLPFTSVHGAHMNTIRFPLVLRFFRFSAINDKFFIKIQSSEHLWAGAGRRRGSVGMCDSFPREGGGRGFVNIASLYRSYKPLPATTQSGAPLPREGIKKGMSLIQKLPLQGAGGLKLLLALGNNNSSYPITNHVGDSPGFGHKPVHA